MLMINTKNKKENIRKKQSGEIDFFPYGLLLEIPVQKMKIINNTVVNMYPLRITP